MLSNWAKQWLVKFNPLKTEAVIFTLKNLEVYPQPSFDNSLIKFVDDQKHLGITFSSNGQCHTHIENVANTAAKILFIMRKLKYTLSGNVLSQLVTCLATVASLPADPGVASSILTLSHTFVKIDYEKNSMVILLSSAKSFKKGCSQLQAKVCARSTG